MSDMLHAELLTLFGAYSVFPDEFKLAGYMRSLGSLGMSDDEAHQVIQHFLEARSDDIPTPSEIRVYAEYKRKQAVVHSIPPPSVKCKKCFGGGWKPVNMKREDVDWNTYPRAVVRCECKQSKGD